MRCQWLFLSLLIAAAGCHGSPSEPTPDLTGKYLLEQNRTSSCGNGGTLSYPVFIQQSGDQISFLLGPDTGDATGTIQGRQVAWQWDIGVIPLCTDSLSGSGSIVGRTLSGEVFAPKLCSCANAKITFTLTPQ
jgi:hypothetical protein